VNAAACGAEVIVIIIKRLATKTNIPTEYRLQDNKPAPQGDLIGLFLLRGSRAKTHDKS